MPDLLTEKFQRYADELRVRPSVPVEQIRARGERRVRRDAVLAVIAAMVAFGLVGALIELSATGGAVNQPLGRPRSTAFPAAFRMPHEGDPHWAVTYDPAAPGAFNPCGTGDLTRTERTAAITMTGSGDGSVPPSAEVRYTEQVLLFSGVTATRNTLLELTAAAKGCGWYAELTEGTALGTVLNAANPPGGSIPDIQRLRSVVILLRDQALIISYADGPAAGNPGAGGTDLDQISDRMCQTMSMCKPARTCYEVGPPPTPSVQVYCSVYPYPTAYPTFYYPEPPANPASVYPGGVSPGPSGVTPGPSRGTPGPTGITPGPSGVTPGPTGFTPGPT